MTTSPNRKNDLTVLVRPTLVAGAGGFIGGHLVHRLVERGTPVVAVDCKPLDAWYQLDRRGTWGSDDLRPSRVTVGGSERMVRPTQLPVEGGSTGQCRGWGNAMSGSGSWR